MNRVLARDIRGADLPREDPDRPFEFASINAGPSQHLRYCDIFGTVVSSVL